MWVGLRPSLPIDRRSQYGWETGGPFSGSGQETRPQLCFGVTDFDETVNNLSEKGVSVKVAPDGWSRIGRFKDPDGNALYVIEMKAYGGWRRLQADALVASRSDITLKQVFVRPSDFPHNQIGD